MRVAIDVSSVPPRPAGAGVYILELVRALAARRDVDLALVAGRAHLHRWEREAPGAGVHAVVPASRPARLAWEQVRAPTLARRTGADLWHGPHYTMPVRMDLPAVVTIHDLTFFDNPEWHERRKVAFFRRMIRISARRAAVLVCVSAHTAARLDALLSPTVPVVVIPHGIDHDRFHPRAEPDDEQRLHALGVRPPYLAFVGTLEPRKNLPALVRAFDAVAADHPDLTLVLAGQPGWGATEVTAAVVAARHGDRVVRPGYVPDDAVPALLRHAAAVVYPALAEGFGFPALEALACGAPVVTTKGSVMEELTGAAALLVAAGDDDALAAAISSVLDDGTVAGSLRAAGPPVAAAYTWERCAAAHVDAYRQAAHS